MLDQWYLGITDELGIPPKKVSCFSGQEKPADFNEVNLLVINTARTRLKDLKRKDQCLLIVDECHRAGSELNSHALRGNYGATLGLSATPEREYDSGFKKFIVPALGKIIYEYGYLEALADRVIVPFSLLNVRVEFLPHERKEYNQLTKKLVALLNKSENRLADKAKIERLLMKRSRVSSSALGRVPLSVKLAEQHHTESIIIFHESIEGANEILTLFTQRGISAVLYHSGIGADMRRDNLRLFKKGVFRILVTCKALDEGMNVPATSVAIIASSTASTRQRIQRLGRVLRPAQNKKSATIYTIYATSQESDRLKKEYRSFGEHVEVQWIKSELGIHGKIADK